MDLSDRKPYTGTLEFIDSETEKPIGLSVEIASGQDPDIRAVNKKWRAKTIMSMPLMKKLGEDQRVALIANNIDDNEFEGVVAAIKGWTWGNGPDGEPLMFEGGQPEFSPEAVTRLFRAVPEFFEQAKYVRDNFTGFFPRPSASLPKPSVSPSATPRRTPKAKPAAK
jgi:hypothetical protein